MGIIFEFIKNDENICFLKKLIKHNSEEILDSEKTLKIFCESRLCVAVIKRVIFFLEKKDIIELIRNKKNCNIDIRLKESIVMEELMNLDILHCDIEKCKEIKDLVPRIRSLKLETLQTKVFGYNEVSKWED